MTTAERELLIELARVVYAIRAEALSRAIARCEQELPPVDASK